ncbi:MAG: methyltransferase domain-containing protein [Rhodospirillaceae bacterium]
MAESPEHAASAAAFAAGYRCRDAGDLAGAERAFRVAVTGAPEDADALGALGETLSAQHRWPEAAAAFGRAAALDPGRPHRLAALAEALDASGEQTAAAEVSRRWLALRPDSVPALLALAHALLGLGDAAAAAVPLREAVLLAPDDADSAARLCRTLAALGQPLEALELAQPALRRTPGHPPLHIALGLAWRALGEREKAAAAFRRSLDLDPEDTGGAAAALAALAVTAPDDDTGAGAAGPDPVFVRALFDRYAERFDADLLDRLDYRAPGLLRAALADAPAGLDILDLGCGTGLAGVAFAPLARHLAGIDLAPRMVEQARRRGLYHTLYVGDLLEGLARAPAAWDLILAADVFTYLGDLEPAVRAAAAALRPGGRLAATVETAPGLAGFEVMACRRVRHGADHLRAAAAAAGLTLTHLEAGTLRSEKRLPVPGLVFVMARPGG